MGLAVVGLAAAVLAAAITPGLTTADAILLGVVEGVTEYLPVSSTGHLTVVERLLDIGTSPGERTAADAYAVCIQAGAILAVVAVYRARLASMANGVLGRDPNGRRLLAVVAAGFVPAALLGGTLGDVLQERLFGVGPIVAAWAVGGLLILLVAPRLPGGDRHLGDLAVRDGLLIGVAQALALWPGISRSLVTILAALVIGLTPVAAVEFSFLLGFVTLGAATLYEASRDGALIVDAFGWTPLGIGLLAAFASAVVAIRWLVEYLGRRGLEVFGWYRVSVAAVIGALLAAGVV